MTTLPARKRRLFDFFSYTPRQIVKSIRSNSAALASLGEGLGITSGNLQQPNFRQGTGPAVDSNPFFVRIKFLVFPVNGGWVIDDGASIKVSAGKYGTVRLCSEFLAETAGTRYGYYSAAAEVLEYDTEVEAIAERGAVEDGELENGYATIHAGAQDWIGGTSTFDPASMDADAPAGVTYHDNAVITSPF